MDKKRAFDSLVGSGFTGMDRKRALDSLMGAGFTGMDRKRRAFDSLVGSGFTGMDKRAFDSLVSCGALPRLAPGPIPPGNPTEHGRFGGFAGRKTNWRPPSFRGSRGFGRITRD